MEAVKTLTIGEQDRYDEHLKQLVWKSPMRKYTWLATAHQHCETYLRVKELWKDDSTKEGK